VEEQFPREDKGGCAFITGARDTSPQVSGKPKKGKKVKRNNIGEGKEREE